MSSIFHNKPVPHQRTLRHKQLQLQQITLRNHIISRLRLRQTPLYNLKRPRQHNHTPIIPNNHHDRYYKSKSIVERKQSSIKKEQQVLVECQLQDKTRKGVHIVHEKKLRSESKMSNIPIAKIMESNNSNILFTAPEEEPESRTPSLQNRQRGFKQSKLVRIRTEPAQDKSQGGENFSDLRGLLSIKRSKQFSCEGVSFPVVEKARPAEAKLQVARQSVAINLKITSIKGWYVKEEDCFP